MRASLTGFIYNMYVPDEVSEFVMICAALRKLVVTIGERVFCLPLLSFHSEYTIFMVHIICRMNI